MEAQAAFFTRPARMHAVQTRTCFLTPATTARTRFRFGFHRRRRVLFAWLITFPKCGALPQNSHFSAIFLPASIFIWAWISCSNCHKTKLLILADPPPPAKRAFCTPAISQFHSLRVDNWLIPQALALCDQVGSFCRRKKTSERGRGGASGGGNRGECGAPTPRGAEDFNCSGIQLESG